MSSPTDDAPDLTKALSRWNAPYWAMRHGVAAALDGADWKVLCALYSHLPNVRPGRGRLEHFAGVGTTSLKRAKKQLKAAGLIDYCDGHIGGDPNAPTEYQIADIRQQAVIEAILERLTGSKMDRGSKLDRVQDGPGTGSKMDRGSKLDRVQDGPGTGSNLDPHPVQNGPPTRSKLDPKVRKRRTQVSTQEKNVEAAVPPGAVAPTSSPRGESVVDGGAEGITTATKSVPKGSLTDRELGLIRSDLSSYAGYWLFGRPAIGKPADQWVSLAPLQTNWAPATRQYGTPEPNVSGSALAAYCCYRVQCARAAAGQPLEMPAFKKLTGIVAGLRKRMTQAEVVALADRIGAHWPAILKSDELRWMTQPPPLNETILLNDRVRAVCDRIGRGENVAAPAPQHQASSDSDQQSTDFSNRIKLSKPL